MNNFTKFFNNVYKVLFLPEATFAKFANEYDTSLLLRGILAYLLATLIDNSLQMSSVVDSIFVWVILVTVIFLIGYVFKLNKADYPKLICLTSFANLPLIFSAPVRLLNDYHPVLAGWLNFVILVWLFNLYVLAISVVADIPKRKVMLFLSIPIVTILMLIASSILKIFFIF